MNEIDQRDGERRVVEVYDLLKAQVVRDRTYLLKKIAEARRLAARCKKFLEDMSCPATPRASPSDQGAKHRPR